MLVNDYDCLRVQPTCVVEQLVAIGSQHVLGAAVIFFVKTHRRATYFIMRLELRLNYAYAIFQRACVLSRFPLKN